MSHSAIPVPFHRKRDQLPASQMRALSASSKKATVRRLGSEGRTSGWSRFQILTWRRTKTDPFVHFELFQRNDWGLVIYDEVHLLPAPVFRVTADLQATRRLGLTATLVREDGHEEDVFTLIGPKRYDVPWKVLERQGWIAEAVCREVEPETGLVAEFGPVMVVHTGPGLLGLSWWWEEG